MDRDALVAKMDAIVEAAQKEERSLDDTEVTEYESLTKQLAQVDKTTEIRARQTALKAPSGSATQTATRSYEDEIQNRAFDSYLRTGQKNMDLVETRQGQNEGTTTAGGYLVPTEFSTKITEKMKAFGGLAANANTITSADGRPLQWTTLDDTANTAEIVAEAATTTGSTGADLVFGKNSLGAYKYDSTGSSNAPLRVSVELLQDAEVDVQDLISTQLATRIARKQSVDLISGNGSGAPLGINYVLPDKILATSNPITYAKLLEILHFVDPAYRALGGCSWLMNDATLALIEGVVDTTGRPLIQPLYVSGAAGDPSAGRLLGWPIVIDQAMPDVANSTPTYNDGCIIFGNLNSAYVIRRVRDVTMFVDPYTRGAYGQIQFFAWSRMDATQDARAAYGVLAGYHA